MVVTLGLSDCDLPWENRFQEIDIMWSLGWVSIPESLQKREVLEGIPRRQVIEKVLTREQLLGLQMKEQPRNGLLGHF